MAFKKATKERAFLRLALFGPSGAGKTYTALRVATGIIQALGGGSIALIDTEHRSASKYADRFSFDTDGLDDNQTIDAYCRSINEAANEGYQVLIIDSLSHGWQELLDDVSRLAKAKYSNNTWSAWSEGTPKQKKLIKALLSYPGHIIATIRSKTEWVQEQDRNGKTKPTRVGLAPEQGKGIEYEFDLLMELNTEHGGLILKDRTGKYQDAYLEKPDEAFGAALAQWLSDGAEPAPMPEPQPESKPKETPWACSADQKKAMLAVINKATSIGIPMDDIKDEVQQAVANYPEQGLGGCTDAQIITAIMAVENLINIVEERRAIQAEANSSGL